MIKEDERFSTSLKTLWNVQIEFPNVNKLGALCTFRKSCLSALLSAGLKTIDKNTLYSL